MPLTKEQRDALPAGHFAVPAKRKLPIHDASHVRLAWDMVDRTQGLSDGERSEARAHILRRAKELGVETKNWEKTLKHAASLLQIEAMAIVMPDVADHPNRMPFTGVMTFLDTPSDLPVGGAGGKRVILPRAVAEQILPSLLGMAIDFTPNLDGHDATRKIGLITSADVVGDEIQIGGFFYAADFPQVCARIKAEKEALGFSYEIKAQTQEIGDLLQIVSGVFTGAAVLRKDKAAYQSTSLAANAAGDIDMTPEELKKLLGEAIAPLTTQLDGVIKDVTSLKASTAPLQANAEMRARVAPHATSLRNCAAAMEAAGIGLDSRHGHVAHLHRMANSMEAEAATGKMPHIFRDHDWLMGNGDNRTEAPAALDAKAIGEAVAAAVKPLNDKIEAQGTTIKDLSAKSFNNTPAPERKTIPAEGLSLLAKAGLKLEGEDGKFTVKTIDDAIGKTNMTRQDGMALKIALGNAGRLEAA